jgi:subtilisin family serine protease
MRRRFLLSVAPLTLAASLSSGDEVQLVIRLKDPPLVAANGPNSKRSGGRFTAAQQRAYLSQLNEKQNSLVLEIAARGGRELGRVSKALNAILVAVDESYVSEVSALPNVSTIRPVVDYEMFLDSTVPYIGAAALHAGGFTGEGVKVAVLDSGVDYTHRNLGGPGTLAAYDAAYGASPADPANKTRDGLFPTSKVIDGFDFVGEVWPNGPRAPDPDPIDFEGHGTHVADIVAGLSADGLHKGVAPGAKILAVKTCSSVSTACSGIALLLGMDFSVDPNGDGAIDDAVDVVNLSLGSDYGQREDDLSEAAHILSVFGVVVVAAAGNSADKPYIVASPSSTPYAISVAQTQVPTGIGYPLVVNSPAAIAGSYANTATVDWAPVGSGFSSAPVVFVGRGCPAGSVAGQPGDDPYLADPAGKVALIDRGACTVSLKVERAAQAGAIGVLIGLVAPGDAVTFAYGGGTTFVPTLVIQQSLSNSIKAQLNGGQTVIATLSPANAFSLAMSMVGSSARGPGYSYNAIKPDIAAPGASVSAEVGTGSGETAFSGTSGAAPMVSGAAALLLEGFPLITPIEVKARLMNTADTNILISPATQPGVLAEITRIGAGEVRVNRAFAAKASAWDAQDPASVSLSFGHFRSIGTATYKRKVLVRNYDSAARTFSISNSFRYPSDAASGAVTLTMPPSVTVPGNGSATFVASLTLNSSSLPQWTLNGGSRGGDGFRLAGAEYDGYVTISDATDTVRLPWHILPHKAAAVTPSTTNVALGGATTGTLPLTNTGGAVPGVVHVFSLTGTSPRLPSSSLPRPGDNFAIVDLRSVGVRLLPDALGPGVDAVQFAVNTWGARSHPNYPAEFDVFIDSDNNGTDDFVVFTTENGGIGVSGQNVTVVQNLATNAQVIRFFTDADLNSANAIMTVLRADIGVAAGAQFRFSVFAGDNYYTGALTDSIAGMLYTLETPRFTSSDVTVPVNGLVLLGIDRNSAGDAASPSQSGLLLMYRDGRTGREADAITVQE